ncbi:MAG: hypothetical protein ACOY30_08790 [Bacillota bacterium]
MIKYTIRGPGDACEEVNAANLDDALSKARARYPDKQIAADAAEVIYVCEKAEVPEACQSRLSHDQGPGM